MGCAAFDDGKGVRGIVCGPGINPKPKRCSFCPSTSVKLCDWPVERAKVIPVASLEAGQRIFPFSDGEDARTLLTVETTGNRVMVTWAYRGVAQSPYSMRLAGNCRLAVMGTCDKPCCHAHHRHVGPDRDYCQDHWRQEEIV
jgi:hypothetical protein